MIAFGILKYWHSLMATMFDSYHPERYYMRGPGPKCRAKQSSAVRRGH
jgi:hypothetical protein